MAEVLTIGPVHTLVQNTVYRMPARNCHLFSNVALQAANTTDFAVPATLAAVTSVQNASAYIRCTTGAAIVTLSAD